MIDDSGQTPNTGVVEDLKDFPPDNEGIAKRWLKEIKLVRNSSEQKNFIETGERIVRTYLNKSAYEVTPGKKYYDHKIQFNILWSNTQVLKPTYYARTPKAIVQQRLEGKDDVTRVACQIGERVTKCLLSLQQGKFNHAMTSSVEDCLLPGRGTTWARYDADFQPATNPDGTPVLDEETNLPIQQPKPGSEKALIDYVHWQDFLHSSGRSYYDWRWVARRTEMTRGELNLRYGKIGNLVKLTESDYQHDDKKLEKDDDEFFKKAEVWEVWDKESKQVIHVSTGLPNQPLKVLPDPLKLEGFFPCPKPLYATVSTSSSYPTPLYVTYEKLADEVDYCSKRMSALIECIRIVGACQASIAGDLSDIVKLRDGQMQPIKMWVEFAERGGFKGAIDWFPIEHAVNALIQLTEYQRVIKAQVDELVGIPDIIRGSSDARETASAQQMKSRWTIIKTSAKQGEVQEFARDNIQKVFEIAFEPGLFQDETLLQMANAEQMTENDQQFIPFALQMLRDDRLTSFKVDVETDSTIAVDDEQNKADAMEYMNAISQAFGSALNIIQYRPELTNPLLESCLHAARAFRNGRDLEASFENAIQQIEQNDAAAAEQPPQPTPEEMKLQSDQAIEQVKMQSDMQMAELKSQIDQRQMMLDEAKAANEARIKELESHHKMALKDFEVKADIALKAKEMEMRTVLDQRQLALDAAKAQLEMTMEARKNENIQQQGMISELKSRTKEATSKPVQVLLQMPEGGVKEFEIEDGKGGVKRGRIKRGADGSQEIEIQGKNGVKRGRAREVAEVQ